MIKHLCDICKKELNSAGICVGEVKVQGTREHHQSVASFVGEEVCPVCIDKILSFIEGVQQNRYFLTGILENKDCKTEDADTWIKEETATGYSVRCPKCQNRWEYRLLTSYCPWCGADLRKDKGCKK